MRKYILENTLLTCSVLQIHAESQSQVVRRRRQGWMRLCERRQHLHHHYLQFCIIISSPSVANHPACDKKSTEICVKFHNHFLLIVKKAWFKIWGIWIKPPLGPALKFDNFFRGFPYHESWSMTRPMGWRLSLFSPIFSWNSNSAKLVKDEWVKKAIESDQIATTIIRRRRKEKRTYGWLGTKSIASWSD